LIWNPGFQFARKAQAKLADWQLRFWQASEDHRGTPDYPGRVATIIPVRGAQVFGQAYCIEGERDSILAYLDHREKGGYERMFFEVETSCGRRLQALSYVGPQDSSSFVGPEPERKTASIIRQAVGPSGLNLDYLRNLHICLERFGQMEPHVERLVNLIETVEH
jgi:glutathione-specific gamma-glutamylcyclotransferase